MTQEDIDNMYREGCRYFYLRTSEGSKAKAEGIFLDILKQDCLNHQAMNMMGLCCQYRAQGDKAREFFRKAIDLSPRPVYYLNLGISLARDQMLTQAQEALQEAVHLESRDPSAHFNLGYVAFLLGLTSEAIDAWTRTLELNQYYEDIHLHLALAYRKAGRTADAEDTLLKGLRRYPSKDELYLHLSDLYESSGKHRKAASLWGAFLRRNKHRDEKVLQEARKFQERMKAKAQGRRTSGRPAGAGGQPRAKARAKPGPTRSKKAK